MELVLSSTAYFPELRTVADVVRLHAERRPEHPAVRCGDRALSYADLDRESDRVALAIRTSGLPRGARLAYLGRESVTYFELLFGAAKSGAVLVPVNWRLTAAEVSYIVRDSDSAVLFVEHDFLPLVEKAVADLPERPRIVPLGTMSGEEGESEYDGWKGCEGTEVRSETGPDDPVVQLYTSGTTGAPKGVVLAQRSFFAIRDQLAEAGLDWIDWYADDVSLIGMPSFHVGGIWWAMQGFNAGITNVCMTRFDSAGAVALVREQGITAMCMVPSMLRLMLAEPGVGSEDFRSIRKIIYGGSPIAESLLEECVRVFACDFAQIYGLTETGNTAICLPPEAHQLGSGLLRAAGRPYPGVGLKILSPSGEVLPPGEVGEVCLRTPARMVEYWKLPEATAATLVGDWVHTGDAGYVDEDGYLFIRDRLKDLIIVGGENIYPAEIENAVTRHPAVADAAVIGVPDDRFGEAVHAYVAPQPGESPSPRDLMLFLKDRIASFKMPAHFEIVDAIPRNPSGKILRRELREKHWSGRARQVN